VETLKSLGSIYWRLLEYEKSRASFEKCLQLSRKIGDKQYEGASLNGIAGVYKKVGDPIQAARHYEEALQVAREDRDKLGQATILHNLGTLHTLYGKHFGEYKKAAEYLEAALAIAKELSDQVAMMACFTELSEARAHMGEWEKAIEEGKAAIELSEKHGSPRDQARALQQYGTMCITLYALGPAESYLEKSLQLSQQINDLGQQSLTYNELGEVYRKSGRYYDAIRCYRKSLGISPDNNPTPLNNLGMIYSDLGQYGQALAYFKKALAMKEKFGRIDVQGITHINIATSHEKLGDDKEALKHYRKAYDICKTTGVDTSRPLGSMGMIHLHRGEIAEAEKHVLGQGDQTSLYAARIYLATSDFKKARKIYEQHAEGAEVGGDMDLRFMIYTGAGLACEGMGDLIRARDHLARAVEVTEDLRSSIKLDERQMFFDVIVSSFFGRTAPYKGLARVLLQMGRPAESLRVSELVKARVFAEAMAKASEGRQSDIPDELKRRGDEIRDTLADLKKQSDMARKWKNESVVKSVEPRIKELETLRAAHIQMLREKYPPFAATKYPEPMDLSQTALKENEWVLEYDVTDSGILIYLTKGKEIVKALFKPVPKKEVDALVREFRKTVELAEGEAPRDKAKQFDFVTGKKLADLLLGDILADLPKSLPLIIVPDGQLGVIPFEMLVLNDGGRIAFDKGKPYVSGAEFFGDRNPISYYQSITARTLARHFGKQREIGQKVLVMDDPIFGPEDPRAKQIKLAERKKEREKLSALPDTLMAAREELGLQWARLPLTAELGESLEELFPGRTDRYTGAAATKQVILQQPLTQYGSIVFATHGYFGKNLPRIQEPVLALTCINQSAGEDGFLRMSRVMELKMNAYIVALTACMSGVGTHISGEGTMGMGRAFQYAGARSVLMSLWTVSERSSVMLAESFFKHLKEGKGKLEALGLAREEIRKAGYDHPFYWASFILVGEVD